MKMRSVATVISHVALHATALAALSLEPQHPMQSAQHSINADKQDLITALQKAQIIPTVTDNFTPRLSLAVFWPNATAEVGNTVDPARVQVAPAVQFLALTTSSTSTTSTTGSETDLTVEGKQKEKGKKGTVFSEDVQLTLALTDPDAPSRDDPEWSQICHWIVTRVPLVTASSSSSSSSLPSSFSSSSSSTSRSALDSAAAGTVVVAAKEEKEELQEIMPYKPPGPPPKTGKHRYVFLALAPQNRTTEALHLVKPGDRQHWGYKGQGKGVREWAEEMGLEVVGANFIYAQNDQQ